MGMQISAPNPRNIEGEEPGQESATSRKLEGRF